MTPIEEQIKSAAQSRKKSKRLARSVRVCRRWKEHGQSEEADQEDEYVVEENIHEKFMDSGGGLDGEIEDVIEANETAALKRLNAARCSLDYVQFSDDEEGGEREHDSEDDEDNKVDESEMSPVFEEIDDGKDDGETDGDQDYPVH